MRFSLRARKVVLVGVLVLGFNVSGLALIDTRTMGEKARTWSESSASRLPTTLEEFSKLPIEYRKAAFRRLTPERKSALWREQMTQFTATEKLSGEQHAVIATLLSLATPEAYGRAPGSSSALSEGKYKAACSAVGQLFSVQQRKAFATLGRAAESASNESRLVTVARRIKRYVGSHVLHADGKVPLLDCDCTVDTYCPDCLPDEGCALAICTQQIGCGCFSLWTCGEKCIYIG